MRTHTHARTYTQLNHRISAFILENLFLARFSVVSILQVTHYHALGATKIPGTVAHWYFLKNGQTLLKCGIT